MTSGKISYLGRCVWRALVPAPDRFLLESSQVESRLDGSEGLMA
jgi:hypothetical protein